jgi:hypothetical protein
VSLRAAELPPAPRPSLTRRLVYWAAGFEDGAIIRAAFFGMLAATLCVLAIDYLELSARDALTAGVDPSQPILPAYDPSDPGTPAGPAVTTDAKLLSQPLAISLVSGGVLALTGTIDKGAADRFAAEIAARGDYVKTVALDSPGGSVQDALAIGKLIRQNGFSTRVAPGALCASSCPLLLAGGKARLASAKSAIGVHQIYAALPAGTAPGQQAFGNAMSAAQQTTATISRYLEQMGVDAALWLHALDTPPGKLYYLTPNELVALKLVTNLSEG